MITQAELRSLSVVRETGQETADEITLFHSLITGQDRLVVRRLRRAASGAWRADQSAASRVHDDVGVTEVADVFGVTESEARCMLSVAQRDGDCLLYTSPSPRDS